MGGLNSCTEGMVCLHGSGSGFRASIRVRLRTLTQVGIQANC